jgi:hypothetical protein
MQCLVIWILRATEVSYKIITFTVVDTSCMSDGRVPSCGGITGQYLSLGITLQVSGESKRTTRAAKTRFLVLAHLKISWD